MGKQKKKNNIRAKLITVGIILGMLLLITVIVGSLSAINVKAGHKAVVVSGLGTIGEQYDEGFQFINPFVQIEYIRWNTQGMDETISILTNDEYNVPVDFQITYHLLESKVGKIHANNPDYKDTVIANVLRSEVRKTASDLNLTGADINKKRTLFESTVEIRCTERMSEYYIVVESINIRNIDLPYSILSSSEDRASAKIDIETASYELEAERARAQKEQIRAEAESNATVILARGQAESLEILASVSGDMTADMMDYILSLRYITALRDPDSNVQFVIVPEDGPALILNLDELEEKANEEETRKEESPKEETSDEES